MKLNGLAFVVISSMMVAGCATGRSNQADIDALNARVTALQGQLAAKDQEMSALQNQLSDERMAREAAESAMKSTRQTAAKKSSVSDLK